MAAEKQNNDYVILLINTKKIQLNLTIVLQLNRLQ